MQTTIVYIIGILALGYIGMTIWQKIKGQGSCCSSGGGNGGCTGCPSAVKIHKE